MNPDYRARRSALLSRVGAPVLLMGNGVRARNLPLTPLPFRQDSNLLYYTGCQVPGIAVLMVHGCTTLYAQPPDDGDALWHGATTTIEEHARRAGIERVRPLDDLTTDCMALHQRPLSVAVPDREATLRAAQLTGIELTFGSAPGNLALVDAIAAQRQPLDDSELAEMRRAARVTEAAHRRVMAATVPGVTERELSALFTAVVTVNGMGQAYDTILTVEGQVLHNFHHDGVAETGKLLLLDGGAESPLGYASDVTRTWPVSGRFEGRQAAAYSAVLEAQESAIRLARPGARYRDLHFAAARVLSQFLADERLIRCAPDDAVAAGAHAVFFPHGLGHLVGLDVHDLESFGDRITYGGRPRSAQFGTAWLRIDLDLVPGMVVTIEPGFYIVPAILGDDQLRTRFGDMVDFDRAHDWLGFGGIRIEDDVLITHEEPDVLTGMIPRTIAELEALVGTAPSPLKGLRLG
jgi:Xaa-Pro aminopeptidase